MIDPLKKDIRLYYAFSFLIGFYVANGTAVLFAQQLGLSFSKIFLMSGVYMLMFILFEIPTGAFADLVGRKKTLLLGCLILTLAGIASGASNNFGQLFASYFLWACGFSLISGAGEAMLYDRIGHPQLYSQIIGKTGFYALAGTAVAGIIGPYLFDLNFRWAYFGSALPFFLGGIVIALFQENHSGKGFTIRNQIEQIKSGVRMGWQNKYIFWSTGILALVFAISYTFSNTYQPYLINIGFPVREFSFILPAMFIMQGLGGWSFGRLLRFGENKLFWLVALGIAFTMAALGLIAIKWSLVIIFGYMFLEGVYRPLVSTYANRHIDSAYRATVISVQSMAGTAMAAMMLFLAGFLTDRVGINQVMIVLGAFVLIVGVALLLKKPSDAAP